MKTGFALIMIVLPVAASASLYASPSSISFYGTVEGGRSISQSTSVTNNGPEDARSVSVSHSCSLDYQVDAYSCNGPLAVYQSCRISVTHTPFREGYSSCQIRVSSETSTTTIYVSGTAVKKREAPEQKPAEPRKVLKQI